MRTMARSKDDSLSTAEANEHIELGRLLQQERNLDDRKSVRKILTGHIPLEEKIRQIRNLDEKQLPEDSENKISDSKNQPFSRSFSSIKAAIKKPQPAAPYLTYLFHHHRKMSEFGKKTHVFINSLFPPRVRPNPSVQIAFAMHLQPDVSALLKMCRHGLAQGWRYLEKKQYNLIAVVEKLCYEILSLNFKVLNFNDRLLSHHFRSLEALFLSLHYQQDYLPDFIESLCTVLKEDPGCKENPDHVEALVQRIFSKDATLPSLYNFLLSLNQYMLRRFVDWEDLIFRDLGEIINIREFACKSEMQTIIDSRVQDLRKQLEILRKQKHDILHLKQIIMVEESDELNLAPLWNFYDHADPSKGSLNFQTDKDNIMRVFPRFLYAFDSTFDPMLSAEVCLAEIGSICLFARNFFQMDFHQLKQLSGKFDSLAYNFRTLSMDRFIDLHDNRKDGIPVEYNIIRLIDDALGLIIQIGKKLESIMASPFRKIDQMVGSSGSTPVIISQTDFYLPDKGREIISVDYLDMHKVSPPGTDSGHV